MEEKGKIKIGLGTLVIIIVIIILVSVICTSFVFMKKDNTNEPKGTNEITNTINNTINTKKEKGSFKELTVTSEGYKINIKSANDGHPSKESLFSTNFEIEHKDGSTYYYTLEYNNIHVYEKGVIFDRMPYETIEINKKSFDYVLNEDENGKVNLIYWIPGEDTATLNFTITGTDVFDKDENYVEMTAKVDEEVLKSDELASVLNFTIEKE